MLSFFLTEANQFQPDDCLKIVSYELSPYKKEEFNSNFFDTTLDKTEKYLRCVKCQRVFPSIKTIQTAIQHSDPCKGIFNFNSKKTKQQMLITHKHGQINQPSTSKEAVKHSLPQSHENVAAKKSKF